MNLLKHMFYSLIHVNSKDLPPLDVRGADINDTWGVEDTYHNDAEAGYSGRG